MATFSIDQLVADCLEARRGANGHAGAAVREVVGRTVADPTAIEAAIGPPADMPSFTSWHNSDELTVLHVVWPPGVDLFAHDHRMWAAIGLYGGREDNALYRSLPGGDLEIRQTTTLRGGDTVLLGDDTVHAVANPSKEWTGAIHVYGGDYFMKGRRMWPAHDQPPEDFDATRLTAVLEAAADRARQEGH
jgi:predicted metal-dependent enzyme (double-stranded beta helix superfamily)